MNDHHRISFNRLYGGMTTDYFAFFCPNCKVELTGLKATNDHHQYYQTKKQYFTTLWRIII